jgi:hypothetical protein
MQELYLDKLVELKKTFLVSQVYKRAKDPFDEAHNIDLLLTDYDDIGLAKGHLSALRTDRYAAIIDLTKREHMNKLRTMLLPGSGYRLFWGVVRSKAELEKKLLTKYKDHVRRYIARNTEWRIDRNESVIPAMQLIYGELFVILKYGSERRRITFEELEKS